MRLTGAAVRERNDTEYNSSMVEQPKCRRRWTFSLRTLFVVMTLAGVACGIGWTVHRVHDRDRLLASLRVRGALVGKAVSDAPARGVPFLWSMLGARPVGVFVLPEDGFTNAEVAEIAAMFPEAAIKQRTWRLDGPTMGRPLESR